MLRLVLALCLALGISPAFATQWYVQSGLGVDGNDGLTIPTAFATPQRCATVAQPGDTCNILPGIGYGGGTSGVAPLVLTTSGTGPQTAANTCTAPITFTGYTGPFAPIPAWQGSLPGYPRPVFQGTRAAGVIMGAYPLSCINIQYIEAAGWAPQLTWAGASANFGAGGTTWQNYAYIGDGLFFAGGTSSQTLHHINFIDNYIHDFPGGGIACNYCDYVTAVGNDVFNTSNYSPFQTSGISFYELHNIDTGTGTKNVISGNRTVANTDIIPSRSAGFGYSVANAATAPGTGAQYISLNGTVTGSAPNYGMQVIDVTNGSVLPASWIGFFSGSGCTNCVGLSSTSAGISSPGVQSGDVIAWAYVTDGEGITIDNNTNTQSDSIAYVGRTLVANNIAAGNGNSGIDCNPGSTACDVFFNTLYQNQQQFVTNAGSDGGEINAGGATSSNIANNLFVATSSTYLYTTAVGTGTTITQNGWSGGASGGIAIPGSNNVTASPNFVNPTISPATMNFQLAANSPAIDAGSASYTRSLDFAGKAGLVGPAYDLGAYEQQQCSPQGTGNINSMSALISALATPGAGALAKLNLQNLAVTISCYAQ